MLVSHGQRFIYLKTRKTAGSSVLNYFLFYCMEEGANASSLIFDKQAKETEAGIVGYHEPDAEVTSWYNHMPAALVRERLGRTWQEYTKFCCIRNPFDKVFSYFWFANGDLGAKYVDDDYSEIRDAFRAWILHGHHDFARDRQMYTIDGSEPCLDAFIRYESLERDLQAICGRVGVKFQPDWLGRAKGQFRPRGLSYARFYDQDTADRVRSAYDREFEWFGYALAPEG